MKRQGGFAARSAKPACSPTRIGLAAGIATSEEALQIARLRLKQMEMILPDARYTLAEKPKLTRENTAWEINWQVLHTGDTQPRRLKMALDREDGFPLHISDLYELQQFEEIGNREQGTGNRTIPASL